MEVEIVTFVIKGSVELIVPPDLQESIQVEIWIIDWQYVINVSICEVELRW